MVAGVAPPMIARGEWRVVGFDEDGVIGFVVTRSRRDPTLFRVRSEFPHPRVPDVWTEVRYLIDADGQGRAVWHGTGGTVSTDPPRLEAGRRDRRPGSQRGRRRGRWWRDRGHRMRDHG